MTIKSESGFSTADLLISTILTLVLTLAMYSVFRVQVRTIKSQESRLEAQKYARATLDLMVREIRNAGLTPTGTGCAGIVTANAQTLQFRLDADSDGDCGGPNEDITYAYVAGTQDITRAADGGGAQNLTSGNATNLQFTYFPQDCTSNFSTPVGGGAAACPLATGGDAGTLVAIQRVSISLTVQSKNPDAEFGGGQLNATMVSSVDLRNRGL